MAEYDSSIALAKRLIEKKGRTGTRFYRPADGEPADPDRPWHLDEGSIEDQLVATAKVVFLDAIRSRSGEVIVAESTAAAYVAMASLPSGLEIEDGFLVVSGAMRYVVLKAELLAPGDKPVMYTLHLKG